MYRYEQRKLNIQLIPQTSWYKNLRSILPNWKDVSEHIRNTQTVCQICGSNDCLHAHEVWEYDDEKHEQSDYFADEQRLGNFRENTAYAV